MEITLRREQSDTGISELKAQINAQGDLVFAGYDSGPQVERYLGDWDFEYWVTVPAAYKDTLLLHLLRDRFQSVHEVRAWLDSLSVPHSTVSF